MVTAKVPAWSVTGWVRGLIAARYCSRRSRIAGQRNLGLRAPNCERPEAMLGLQRDGRRVTQPDCATTELCDLHMPDRATPAKHPRNITRYPDSPTDRRAARPESAGRVVCSRILPAVQ